VTTVRKNALALFAAATLALFVLGGCNAVAPYAAKVNGERITVSELNRELRAVRGNRDYVRAIEAQLGRQGESTQGASEQTFGSAFVAQTLSRRIYFEVIHQELAERRLRVTRQAVDDARRQLLESEDGELYRGFPPGFVDEIARFTAEVELLRENLTAVVTDDEVRRFYDENPQFFEQTCARQIVTGGYTVEAPVPPDLVAEARATAEDIKRRLDAGGDFAAIATAESKDPRSAPQGGDLGCVASNAFPPEVAASVGETEIGKVAGPVRTDNGFYLVLVQSRQKEPFDEVAGQIRQFLEQQSGDPLSELLAKELAQADISVNPRYGTFEQGAGELPTVVPPDAPRPPPGEPVE
jgi:hypothetical protein